jgi:hypothetical protein
VGPLRSGDDGTTDQTGSIVDTLREPAAVGRVDDRHPATADEDTAREGPAGNLPPGRASRIFG